MTKLEEARNAYLNYFNYDKLYKQYGGGKPEYDQLIGYHKTWRILYSEITPEERLILKREFESKK